ncbi:hypothetical protein K8O68_13555 [Salipaludibacillus sp. CUR1]|uniref:hypothetical protein n=1 Tax=Salipaludibacillus sp. CUR1 TaxID=2820003 RepID=UPI001E288E04|nr:hypothetical protein [Salipaludibacillus sp. CUR1]MCE7793447.1 hypothetical protein [Salipaludibacillus sp. CUR1]
MDNSKEETKQVFPKLKLQDKVELFMYPFMNELEKGLVLRKDDLKNITFHHDEANTDRELKEYLQELIENHFATLPYQDQKEFYFNSEISGGYVINYSLFSDIFINKVYLPNEMTEEIKVQLRKQNSVYTDPDIVLEITDTNHSELIYVPVELKSTKKNAIPGSSIQQITPTEWVIFVKHSDKGEIEITTGQYIYAVNSTMQFPDRSPRPSVAFNELVNWNKTFRREHKGKTKDQLAITIKADIIEKKSELLEDWQGVLVERWLKVIEKRTVKKNEAWFNNTIRNYTLEFLNNYESLSPNEKVQLKETINEAIEKYNKYADKEE